MAQTISNHATPKYRRLLTEFLEMLVVYSASLLIGGFLAVLIGSLLLAVILQRLGL